MQNAKALIYRVLRHQVSKVMLLQALLVGQALAQRTQT